MSKQQHITVRILKDILKNHMNKSQRLAILDELQLEFGEQVNRNKAENIDVKKESSKQKIDEVILSSPLDYYKVKDLVEKAAEINDLISPQLTAIYLSKLEGHVNLSAVRKHTRLFRIIGAVSQSKGGNSHRNIYAPNRIVKLQAYLDMERETLDTLASKLYTDKGVYFDYAKEFQIEFEDEISGGDSLFRCLWVTTSDYSFDPNLPLYLMPDDEFMQKIKSEHDDIRVQEAINQWHIQTGGRPFKKEDVINQ
jgi:hypothetical protein